MTRCLGAWARHLCDLCDELTIDPHAARVRLRRAGIKTTGGAYCWAEGDELAGAREVL